MADFTYKEDFVYKHDNPYHDRLEKFSEFVLRDNEAESFRGEWNSKVFHREAPLILEIGTGYGHFMMEYCENHPEVNFIGMDYRFKRSFDLAKKLALHPHKNFKYLRARGERTEFLFNENELDSILYFFPDPWPKNKHKKKRLFQERFLQAAHKVLKPGGKIYIKTDHDDYAAWMAKYISETKLFDCELESWDLRAEHPDHFLATYTTKFEKIFLEKGIPTKAFVLINKKEKQDEHVVS